MVSSGIASTVTVNFSNTGNIQSGNAASDSQQDVVKFQDVMSKSMDNTKKDGQEIKDTTKTVDVVKKANVKIQETQEQLPEEMDLSQVEEIVNAIRQLLMQHLQVTPEEIDVAMQELNIDAADFFDKSQITDLIMNLTDIESPIELIANPLISQEFADVMAEIDTVLTEFAKELEMEVPQLYEMVQTVVNMQEKPQDTDNTANDVAEVVETVEVDAEEKVMSPSDNNEKVATGDDTAETSVTGIEESLSHRLLKEDAKSESDFAGQSNAGNHHMTGFVENLTKAVDDTFAQRFEGARIDTTDVINQIMDAAKARVNQEITTMEIQLNPENLGKVHLTVSTNREGIMTAQLVAQNAAVKEVLENQMVVLRENFANQGLKVEAVEVTVASHGFEAGTYNQNSSNSDTAKKESDRNRRQLRLDSLSDLSFEELTQEEQIVMEMMEQQGNQVDFTA